MSDAKITLSAEDKTRAAFADVKRNLLGLQQSALGINQAFGATGAILGSAFAGFSLTAFIKATADGLDKLNDIKDATGSTVESISALEDVAARTGTSIDTVTSSLIKFNGALSDSKAGSDNDNVFRSLGLDVAELKRIDPAEALRLTAVALSGYADNADKARAVQQLFGKSLREVAPFLNDLAAVGALNAKVTAQQAEEAEKFNKQLAALDKNSLDFARSLVSDVLPGMNTFLEKLQAINRSGGLFTSIGKELRADVVGAELRRVVSEIESIQATIDRQGGDSYLERKLAGLRGQASALTKESQQLSEWLKKFANTADPYVDARMRAREDRGFVPERPSLVVPGKSGNSGMTTIDKPMFGVGMDQIPESLKEARKLIDDTDVSRVARYREQLQELIGIINADPGNPAVVQAITGVTAKISALDPEYQAAIKAQKDLNDLLEKTRLFKMEKLRGEVQLLEQAFLDGKLGIVGTSEAVEAYQAAVAELTKEATADVRKAADNMDEFATEAARNIQDALGTTLKSTLRGDFDNIGDLWANLLLDMAAQAAAAQLGKVLLGDFGTSGNIGGLLGDGLSWLGSFGLGIGRADGGPVGANRVQRVNERGFEVFTDANGGDWLMTGARGGMVTPNNQVAAGGGSRGGDTHVLITNHVSGGMQRGEVYAMVQSLGQQIRADVFRALKDTKVIA